MVGRSSSGLGDFGETALLEDIGRCGAWIGGWRRLFLNID